MTRVTKFLPCAAAALLALGAALPAAGQQAPDSFTLPSPAPTPTPAPEGPADERAGVVIPPRATTTPAPSPAPAPSPSPPAARAPAPSPSAIPTPRPSPTALQLPPSSPRPAASAPAALPAPTQEAATSSTPAPPVASPPLPILPDGSTPEDAPRDQGPRTGQGAPAAMAEPSDPLGTQVFGWGWLAAAAALIAALIGGWRLWRARRPKVLRLAAPSPGPSPAAAEPGASPALHRIDLGLEIIGATRSLMMFTLQYRLTLANRTERAVNDLAIAVQLASAQRGASNAAPLSAARHLDRVERIGPHQSRSIEGEVQLPIAAITPVMQGKTPLFIPLVHVTLEGEGVSALSRSFVVGPPSGGEGRLHPLPFDLPPGSLSGLRARQIVTEPA